ncbi:MAG: TM2 domain-containing protein [Thermosynechococcaceae cyanobacterium]
MAIEKQDVSLQTAYALCGLGVLGPCGLHRFYLGKPVSGTIWLLTFGFFGIGQWIDLALIPSIANERRKTLNPQSQENYSGLLQQVWQQVRQKRTDQMQVLLNVAIANQNELSLGRAILETGLTADETEALLIEATRRGLAHVGNDPDSGAVRYYFDL